MQHPPAAASQPSYRNPAFSPRYESAALDGYALLCQHKPDIVLLDVMMPMLDGWSVLRKIRSNQAVSKVRVIVVTGLGPEAAKHEAGRLGVTSILHKPILPSQLVKAVRAALAE